MTDDIYHKIEHCQIEILRLKKEIEELRYSPVVDDNGDIVPYANIEHRFDR
jgi:hypothetical protein